MWRIIKHTRKDGWIDTSWHLANTYDIKDVNSASRFIHESLEVRFPHIAYALKWEDDK